MKSTVYKIGYNLVIFTPNWIPVGEIALCWKLFCFSQSNRCCQICCTIVTCHMYLFPICTNICTVVTSCICSITMHNICYNIFPAHSVNKLFYFVSNEPCWLGCTCLKLLFNFYLWHSSLSIMWKYFSRPKKSNSWELNDPAPRGL